MCNGLINFSTDPSNPETGTFTLLAHFSPNQQSLPTAHDCRGVFHFCSFGLSPAPNAGRDSAASLLRVQLFMGFCVSSLFSPQHCQHAFITEKSASIITPPLTTSLRRKFIPAVPAHRPLTTILCLASWHLHPLCLQHFALQQTCSMLLLLWPLEPVIILARHVLFTASHRLLCAHLIFHSINFKNTIAI